MTVRISRAAMVLAGLLLLAGCGGGESQRDAVAQYIRDVNVVETELQAPTLSVSTASRELAKENVDREKVGRTLLRAANEIDRMRTRLAQLETPPEARRLRSLLLELTSHEGDLAREVAALASYLPQYSAALKRLSAAGGTLNQALDAKGTLVAKATALEAYAATIGKVLVELHTLRPPPVAKPDHATQTTTLTRVRASAVALAAALRENRAADLPRLTDRFEQAARSNQSTAAQKARIAAVLAYNERVKRLDGLSLRINRERARLQSELD